MAVRINQLSESASEIRTLIVGMRCNSVRGFLFMWFNIFHFIWATRSARGVLQTYGGIASPFEVILISYWESEAAMIGFVKTPAHRKWMNFIVANPKSLHLFNETYEFPVAVNFIGRPRGYAAAKVAAGETTSEITSYTRRTG